MKTGKHQRLLKTAVLQFMSKRSPTVHNPLFFVHKFDRPRAVFYLLQSRWRKTREPRESRELSPRRKSNNFLVSPQSLSRSLSKNSTDLREKWT